MNIKVVEDDLSTVRALGHDEFTLFVRELINGLTFKQCLDVIRHASSRMQELQDATLCEKIEYAQALAFESTDENNPAFRARKLRALLRSGLYRDTTYGRELEAEYKDLCKDPLVVEYLRLTS